MDFLVELGGKIRYRRQQLNISQQELAEAVGYTSMCSATMPGSLHVNLMRVTPGTA